MTKVWSGKLDCTFHGKMHWELNKEMWFASTFADRHYDRWKDLGVKIVRPKSQGFIVRSKVYAPAGYHTDLASIPRVGWMIIAPWDVARAAIIHDVLYGALRTAFLSGSMDVKKIIGERTSLDGTVLIGIGVVCLLFSPQVKWMAWGAIAYGAWTLLTKEKGE